jgi:hypothetical protein
MYVFHHGDDGSKDRRWDHFLILLPYAREDLFLILGCSYTALLKNIRIIIEEKSDKHVETMKSDWLVDAQRYVSEGTRTVFIRSLSIRTAMRCGTQATKSELAASVNSDSDSCHEDLLKSGF